MSNAEVVTYERLVSGNPVYDDDLKIAPWKIGEADFTVSTDRELITKALENIRGERCLLVLAAADGSRYGNTILLKFDDENLSIDKPIDFDDTGISSCRVYFRDIVGVWCFFEIELIKDCPFSLCAAFPDALHRLYKRLYNRVNVPAGTRVLFRHGDNLRGDCMVTDISASGMLICAAITEDKIADNAEVSDIALVLPRVPSSGEAEGDVPLALPLVSKGRIVRSFGEQETDLIYHGISFRDDLSVMAGLDDLVGKIKRGARDE